MNLFKSIFCLAMLAVAAGPARADWSSELMYAPHALERSSRASPAEAPVRALRLVTGPWMDTVLRDFLQRYAAHDPGRFRAMGFRMPVPGCQLIHRCFYVIPVVSDLAHCRQAQRAKLVQRLVFEFSPACAAFAREFGAEILQSALISVGNLVGLAMPDIGAFEDPAQRTLLNGYFIELPKGFLANPEDLCRN